MIGYPQTHRGTRPFITVMPDLFAVLCASAAGRVPPLPPPPPAPAAGKSNAKTPRDTADVRTNTFALQARVWNSSAAVLPRARSGCVV